MRTMMRSAAAVGVVVAAAMTVGTMSTLAAGEGAEPSARVAARVGTSASGNGAGVRVTISDDTRSAHPGDVVDYTVRVDNESATSYPALEVYHLVPPGYQLVDSTPHARQEDSTLRWTAAVPAGGTAVFTDQVMAGTVEESEHLTARDREARPGAGTATRQVMSTACAKSSATGPALACGTVREQLTDGPGTIAGAAGPAPKHWQPGLLGIGLIFAMYVGARGFWRRRRAGAGEG